LIEERGTMIRIILLILTIPLLTYITVGQSESNDLDNAEAFALKIAKSIIEKDCENFSAYFNDSIVLLQKKDVLKLSEIKERLNTMCGFAVKNDSVTYEYYLENFERHIYGSDEIEANKSFYQLIKDNPSFELSVNDYLYIGFRHKTGNYNDYLLNDPFNIIFRKVDGDFKIMVFADN
jgi:hypothetical protein